jgi:glutamate-1-semialdehyde 2,1-aminomutase
MLTAFFQDGPVMSFADAVQSDVERYAAFHAHMLDRGIYLAPSQFEAMMPCLAHTDEHVAATIAAARDFPG